MVECRFLNFALAGRIREGEVTRRKRVKDAVDVTLCGNGILSARWRAGVCIPLAAECKPLKINRREGMPAKAEHTARAVAIIAGCSAELATPQIQRQGRHAALVLRHEPACNSFVGVDSEHSDRREDRFFGIVAKLHHEIGQQREAVPAKSAEKSPDAKGVNLRHAEKTTLIAAVPAQPSCMAADLAIAWFGDEFLIEAILVILDPASNRLLNNSLFGTMHSGVTPWRPASTGR